MVNQPEPRHIHSGMSSRGLLNPEKILGASGLKKGDAFLDAGCGDGYFSMVAASIVGHEGKVYAVDIDEEAIATLKKEISRQGINNIEAFTTDISSGTPLASQSIDFCLMSNVLHGFVANNETEGTLQEITRLLKAGATLVVVDFQKMSSHPGPPLSIRMTPQEVARMITPYHYQEKQVIEVSPYHYAAVFSKE